MTTRRPRARRAPRATAAVLLASMTLLVAACGGDDDTSTTTPVASPTVNVGRTTDPLNDLLATAHHALTTAAG